MNNKRKIKTALVVVAAVGAILGILFGSDKGCEIRRKINKQGKRIADVVQDKFREGKEKLGDMKEDIAHTVKEKARQFS